MGNLEKFRKGMVWVHEFWLGHKWKKLGKDFFLGLGQPCSLKGDKLKAIMKGLHAWRSKKVL